MNLPFKSKKALRSSLPLQAASVCVETSVFGPELKANGKFVVCLYHPKQYKFAQITVTDGLITAVS